MTKELALHELKLAVHMIHGCDATDLIETVQVPTDVGVVDVFLFAVEGEKRANRCFVWQTIENRITTAMAVFQDDEIRTAADALSKSPLGSRVRSNLAFRD